METYSARYKCRRCGEIFTGSCCGKSIALQAMALLSIQESFYPEGSGIGVNRYETHLCGNGEYGFADFIGFDREKRLVDDGNGEFHYEYVK